MTPNFSKYTVYEDSTIIGQYKQPLKPAPNSQGYLSLKMTDDTGRLRNVTVHRIVAATYLGLIYENSDVHVDHIDGDKLNNHVSNLRLVTNAENTQYHQRLKTLHIPTDHAECKMCGIIKHKTRFDKSNRNNSGCQSYCKDCRRSKP